MSRNNVTYIDDLPYLEELEKQSMINGVPPNEMKQISKFIRDTGYNPPHESGMNLNYPPPPSQPLQQQPLQLQPQQQQLPPPPQQQQQENYQIIDANVYGHPPHIQRALSMSCIDVAEHTANCIVCSKIYNTDNSLYVIAISVLLLIIVILIKKILDLQKF